MSTELAIELGRTSVLPLAADQAAYVLKGDDAGVLVTGPVEVVGRCTLAVITLQRTVPHVRRLLPFDPAIQGPHPPQVR